MSIEDLEQHGVLLPKDEWGTHKIETTTSEVPLLFTFLVSVAGCTAAFLGAGTAWTWIGIVVFFVAFAMVIVLCDRAIEKQRDRVKHEREEHHEKDTTSEGA